VPGVRVGGCILNKFTNPEDPCYEEYKSTHAEYSLIKNHKKGCPAIKHIIVIRVHQRKLKLGMSRPCNICQQLMLDYGVETVTYSYYQGLIITESVEELTSGSSSDSSSDSNSDSSSCSDSNSID
jgi:cytidine deaminase